MSRPDPDKMSRPDNHIANLVIEKLEKRIRERIHLKPEFEVLKSVPGIGDVLASTILLETGSVERFAEVGNYVSYSRCVGSGRYSNGDQRHHRDQGTGAQTGARLLSHA